MDRCPVFCLKTNTDSDGTLRLVNEDGIGNGVPTRSSFSDLDHRFNYSTGDVGKIPLRQPHEMVLSMDEVTPEVREKLLDWKFKRRAVTLCDDEGLQELDETNYLIKPKDHTSGVYPDETGKHSLQVLFDESKYVWDLVLKEMIVRSADELVVERTPFGDGARFHGPVGNLGDPSSPESNLTGFGAGNCGWDLTLGTGVASSFENTFPNADYTGVLGLTSTTDGVATIGIPATQLGVAPFTGEGSFVFIVWLKGTMGRTASGIVGASGSFDTQDLSGKVFDDWTPVMFRAHQGDWTGLSPSVLFILNNGTDENGAFYIGPHMACFVEGSDYYDWPHWCFDNSALATIDGFLGTKANVPMPASGTMTLDFVIPDHLDLFNMDDFTVGLAEFGAASAYGRWDVSRYETGDIVFHVGNVASFQYIITDETMLAPGRHIWSVTFDDSANQMVFIADGKTRSEQSLTVSGWAGSNAVAKMGMGYPASCASIYFLGMRLDDYVFDSRDLAEHQTAVMDNVARGLRELSKNRWYEIVSVPQTALIQAGNSLFMGDLILRQTSYAGSGVWYAQEESE